MVRSLLSKEGSINNNPYYKEVETNLCFLVSGLLLKQHAKKKMAGEGGRCWGES